MTHEAQQLILPIEHHDEQLKVNFQSMDILGLGMGLKDRLWNLFNNKRESHEETTTETSQLNDDNSQFLAMAKEISDELIDELTNEEQNPQVEVETILISEYDAGDVEAEQLVDEEDSMSNHNEVNVITHDSLEDIVEHLEGAEIIGDLPKEVKF
tara:strand:- start:391 stop:855 length:465 start_codon:yes stop_codon:yes gene_type:complete